MLPRSHHPRRSGCATALLLVLLPALGGCTREPPPAYVRLDGPAPLLAEAPVSRALLVVFWASWCPPCREEAPSLTRLAQAPPEGLKLVVLSQDASLAEANEFFEAGSDRALHLRLDPGARVFDSFGGGKLPTSVLVVDGRLVARFSGPQAWDSGAMRRLLDRLLRERGAPHAPALTP
ncbi:MAG: TlpA disulfide reductase family protein [Myxococcales bacterium]